MARGLLLVTPQTVGALRQIVMIALPRLVVKRRTLIYNDSNG